MNKSQTLTSLKKRYTYRILDNLEVNVAIKENPFDLSLDDLFCMAARKNKKRSFLFVSKVLGKHIPIVPQKGHLVGQLLALRYSELIQEGSSKEVKDYLLASFEKEEPVSYNKPFIGSDAHPVIIGFAETATALGHSFFDCFLTADYFHTTRENLSGTKPLISFEEEHSHATSHRCYVNEELLMNQREVILVDDEVTTGKTALNIIRSIHERFPRSIYSLVSILDWRSEADRLAFSELEKELNIKINCVSLVSGDFELNGKSEIDNETTLPKFEEISEIEVETIQLNSQHYGYQTITCPSISQAGIVNANPYILPTGRFGLNSEDLCERAKLFENIGTYLKSRRTGKKTLCLGTGEFMYIPMKISSEMGSGVMYQSTTRSPVYVKDSRNYGAQHGISFLNPEDTLIQNFIYNIPPKGYDEIFLFFERKVEKEELSSFLQAFSTLEIQSLKMVFFTGDDGIAD